MDIASGGRYPKRYPAKLFGTVSSYWGRNCCTVLTECSAPRRSDLHQAILDLRGSHPAVD